MLKNIILVGIGGATGSILRYLISLVGTALLLNSWAATACANGIGSFLIGLFMSACSGDWKLMLTAGLCGGFTTYSTFSSQSLEMLRAGNYTTAGLYIIGTLCICMLLVWAGLHVGSKISNQI